MASFAAVCQRILALPHFTSRALTGGLISFIPIVNILALGYLLQFARRLRHGHLSLPAWENWGILIRDGLIALLIYLVWAGIPMLLGFAISVVLSKIFGFIGLGFLGWAPFTATAAAGLPLSVMALLRYAKMGELADAFDITSIVYSVRDNLPLLAVPTLACFGIFAIGWPVYGLASFVGLLLIIAHYAVVLER